MCQTLRGKFASLGLASACALVLAAASSVQAQVDYSQGQYGRPQPVAIQCQNALADRVSADAGRHVNLNLDSQDLYSQPNGRQGIRGRMRYGIGGPNTWRTGTYECVFDPRTNRVERANYRPRADSGNWPGPGYPGGPGPGPGYPGGPGGPGYPSPGIPNYPRVKVDTPMQGTYDSRSGSFNVTRGYVDSRGPTPSITVRGDNYRITFYGVVERSDGGGFTMRITGSDRGDARGTAQARLNNDRNEVQLIILNGRIGRDDFSANINRR
jgi:hypothetical protein